MTPEHSRNKVVPALTLVLGLRLPMIGKLRTTLTVRVAVEALTPSVGGVSNGVTANGAGIHRAGTGSCGNDTGNQASLEVAPASV